MTGILGDFGAQLGKGLADKWLSLLALPGALYLAVCAAAQALGQAHALDAPRLAHQVTTWAHAPAVRTTGGQIVVLVAVLAASVAAGLAARALGAGIERVALAADWRSWPRPAAALARRRTDIRRRRWDAAHREYSAQWARAARAAALDREVDPTARRRALGARAAISAERPDRPTWSGDRVHAVALRLRRDQHLDLGQLWPYIWLSLPEGERTELVATRSAGARAAELGAWSVLYAALAAVWWPAGVLAVLLAATARRRARSTTDSYAQLVEAVVRLHSRELMERFGIEDAGPPSSGDRLGDALGSAPPVVVNVAEPGGSVDPASRDEPGGGRRS
ncbi:hypothetical protein ACFWVU_00755 [Streptomyces sp. NPDC058686]|uniref:hypothetical protein n=1 Tax=Streptomyces sp. NPDC058686 TaxID=3346599 RepID=UPI0036691818